MEPVHDRGSMDPVHESGPWTRSKVGVHGPLVHVLSSPENKSGFASERLWFLGHSVELACVETPPPLKKNRKKRRLSIACVRSSCLCTDPSPSKKGEIETSVNRRR